MSSESPVLMSGKARMIRTAEGLGLEILIPAIRLATGRPARGVLLWV